MGLNEGANLNIYNAVREVPKEAQKTIGGGRLKGMTDINPMWRIKALTEQFGPAGIGWYYEITEKRLEQSPGGKEVAAFVDIALFVKSDNEWSKPIVGTGGSSFIANERNGAYMSDECFKMALTDAIGVACKALGVGADIYWAADRTKYDARPEPVQQPQQEPKRRQFLPSYIHDTEWIGKVCGWLHQQELKAGDKFRAYNVIEQTFSGIQPNEIQILIAKYNEYKANHAGTAA